jgi:hypothetical protein
MEFLKFLTVLLLGIAIGAGGLLLYGFVQHRSFTASAADNYNACLQDAKIGMFEHAKDVDKWFPAALEKCAKQYRIDREHGR